jgi:hypothetical protein
MIGRIAPVAAAAGFAIMARNARAARQRCSGRCRLHGRMRASASLTAARTKERLVMLGAWRACRTGTRKDRHAAKTARSERWIS